MNDRSENYTPISHFVGVGIVGALIGLLLGGIVALLSGYEYRGGAAGGVATGVVVAVFTHWGATKDSKR